MPLIVRYTYESNIIDDDCILHALTHVYAKITGYKSAELWHDDDDYWNTLHENYHETRC